MQAGLEPSLCFSNGAFWKSDQVQLCTTEYDGVYGEGAETALTGFSGGVEIGIVVAGSGIHRILNETYECRAGDLFVVGGGMPHGYFSGNEEEHLTVCTLSFDPSRILEGEWADLESPQYCCGVFRDRIPVSYAMLNGRMKNQVYELCEAVAGELETQAVAWQMAVRSHIITLLVTISRYINLADTICQPHPKEWALVSAAIRGILECYGDSDMTLESIASSLFLSQSHLSRVFQRVTGSSFMDYVRKVRIEHACELLRTTSLTNEEIVGRCGLKDIPSFYRLFKSQIGITPYQYRMSQKTYQGSVVMSIYLEISENLQRGKAKVVQELVQKAIDDGLPAAQILNEGLLSGMNIVGEKFKNNEVYVPEVLVAARAMNMGVQILKPLLVDDGVQSAGRVCIGTVQGDLHDIGKNLVKMMMEGKGLEVVDLGVDVAPERFVQAAIENNCQVISCSALLTTTMDVMAEVVRQAEAAGVRDKVKIMVGGAPVTQEFCDKIGADCYTVDAASAADAAVELCAG